MLPYRSPIHPERPISQFLSLCAAIDPENQETARSEFCKHATAQNHRNHQYFFSPLEVMVDDAAVNGHGPAAVKQTPSANFTVKAGLAKMLKGGVIMDVVNAEQARIAEEAGACAVMALERVPADIRAQGGVARMSDPKMIKEIIGAVTIPVMAKARIGHSVECQVRCNPCSTPVSGWEYTTDSFWLVRSSKRSAWIILTNLKSSHRLMPSTTLKSIHSRSLLYVDVAT